MCMHACSRMQAAVLYRNQMCTVPSQEFMPHGFRQHWYGSAEQMPEGATQITCLPLSSVLWIFGVTYIDFFSLDVEGAELQVLQTLDFNAVHISVIVVEMDGHDLNKDEAVAQLLRANNFERDDALKNEGHGASITNGWFVNKNFKPYPKSQHRR